MYAHMYITVFFLTVLVDFWANWYYYAIVHDWIVLQAFLGLALPFLNFPSALFFVDQPSIEVRFKLCTTGAFGMMFGSTLMLLMVRAGFGVGTDVIP